MHIGTCDLQNCRNSTSDSYAYACSKNALSNTVNELDIHHSNVDYSPQSGHPHYIAMDTLAYYTVSNKQHRERGDALGLPLPEI